ncbi:MAG: hypothetical protein V1848_01375 [Candidatus Magasanikbacteria bacterium]
MLSQKSLQTFQKVFLYPLPVFFLGAMIKNEMYKRYVWLGMFGFIEMYLILSMLEGILYGEIHGFRGSFIYKKSEMPGSFWFMFFLHCVFALFILFGIYYIATHFLFV